MNINYPKSLNKIFLKLMEHGIDPIIVGGYVRDSILNQKSHDIDIELYNIHSFEYLEKFLCEFGSVNSVGKSFGICKLKYKDLELDFSLPRTDSKISSGHQGFKIEVDTSLNFTQASSRRDFTINAIGYDIKSKKILDPFHGREDIEKKILKAVDLKKFDEDPLRVLRAISFSSRLEFKLDDKLFKKCKSMIKREVLQELPQERIFQEIKKILLKSKKPSKGFKLLKELNGFDFFTQFTYLKNGEYEEILQSLDTFKKENIQEENSMIIMLALICSKFSKEQTDDFLNKITKSKKIIAIVEKLNQIEFNLDKYNDYNIYKLATKIDIEIFTSYLHALYVNKENEKIELLKDRAKILGVLHKKVTPFIVGKDLISLGMQPSTLFSKILTKAYELQICGEFQNRDEALNWLKS